MHMLDHEKIHTFATKLEKKWQRTELLQCLSLMQSKTGTWEKSSI